jgi:CheY-like chemotaxis protein
MTKGKKVGNEGELAGVGQMTADVLHEFNNVLQGIIGLAEMLDADGTLPEKARVGMKAIRRLGQNATNMVQSIFETGEETLPMDTESHDIEAVTDVQVPEVLHATKTSILVVEDDPLVLNVVTGMLKYLGYRTFSATNGIEAVKAYANNQDLIGMVITDLVMPKMGGLDLAKQLQVNDSDVKIVVMTGYLQEDLNLDLIALGLAGWLEKPMTAERLRQVVAPIMGK